MYKKKGSDHGGPLRRFLSHSNDSLKRLKFLRSELDKVSVSEAKRITEEFSATVFYVVYTSFTTIEAQINERAQRGRSVQEQMRELKEVILPSFERVIILLPERIQQRWQYHSLCLVIRKLLHPDNSIELRQNGIKLLVLMLQALQDKAGDAVIELFASAIPYFPPKKTPLGLPDQSDPSLTTPSGSTLCDRYGVYSRKKNDPPLAAPNGASLNYQPLSGHGSYTSLSRGREWVVAKDIRPLSSNHSPIIANQSDPTLQLMEYLLTCLTRQVGRLKWTDTSNHVRGFSFLFFQFKLFYLACLYRNFRSDAGLYCQPPVPVIEIPSREARSRDPSMPKVAAPSSLPVTGPPKHSKHTQSVSAVIKLDFDTSDPIYITVRHLVLKFLLQWIMPGFHSNRPGSVHPSPPTPSPALDSSVDMSFIPKSTDMMRDMWLTSKDNINLLFEICHQGFKLPLSHFGVVNKLTELYGSWVQDTTKPLFMKEPLPKVTVSLPIGEVNRLGGVSELSVSPWEVYSGYSGFDSSDVRAGTQQALRMFISHTRQFFLHQAPQGMLENQEESGTRIIKLYQDIMNQWSLDLEGWVYMLKVLLHLCLQLMKGVSPSSNTLGAKLAGSLLQTLLVGYVRASMAFELPVELWDSLMDVLSYLTGWSQVVVQWAEIMKKLTQCLSIVVYHLDLEDLPLNHSSRSDERHRIRNRTRTMTTERSLSTKQIFTDIKPQLLRTTVSTTPHGGKGKLQIKAISVDSRPSSAQDMYPPQQDEPRRASTPAYTSSSVQGTRKEVITYKSDLEILEEAEIPISDEMIDAEDKMLLKNTSTTDLSTDGPNSSLIISNEGISSDKEDEDDFQENNTERISTLKRSLSETALLSNSLKKEDKMLPPHSISPDLTTRQRLASSTLTRGPLFPEFVPKPGDASSPPPPPATPIDKSPSPARPPLLRDTSRLPRIICEDKEPQSGSPHEGQWNQINVSKVWFRMLLSLGDINKIEDPLIHAKTMKSLALVWTQLQEIEKNLGVSLDDETTPLLPDYLPPVMLILPWIVKACSLPPEYKEGRNIAYQLLCEVTLRHVSCTTPPSSFLPHFYRLMHLGLQPDSDVLFTTVREGSRLLSFGLEGVAVLHQDVILACRHILHSGDLDAPRSESLTLLGDLYYVAQSKPETESVTKLIFEAVVKEPLRQARCFAVYLVGMICVRELAGYPSEKVEEGINILLACLKFSDISIVLSAVDMLSLLTEQVDQLAGSRTPPSLLQHRVVQGIASAAASLINAPSTDKKTKTLISVLLCLRDWTLTMPVNQLTQQNTLTDLLEVLHAAASGAKGCRIPPSPVKLDLHPLETSPPRPTRGGTGGSINARSLQKIEVNVSMVDDFGEDQVVIVARSIIHHLLCMIGHFPFPCGAGQMSSVVCEYHDCPSLEYLEELSPEIFDSPRVQFFSLNDEAIVTFIEIPIPEKGVPSDIFSTASYQCRVIIRDITGRYCWDSTVLFGPSLQVQDDLFNATPMLIKPTESTESLYSAAEESERSSSSLNPEGIEFASDSNPLQPPSWQSEASSVDHLHKLLAYVESTSSECVLFPDQGLAEPSPAVNEPVHNTETKLQSLIEQQSLSEADYIIKTGHLPCMKSLPTKPPDHCTMTFAFHYCHLFLSHMGYLSWNKRNFLDLLDKTDRLIREIRHLDGTQTQSRQTYKVAVLYVSCGQEDKQSILLNSQGSRPFEEFVSGLGWEVDMSTHLGYTGGLKPSYSKGCTMPYYATSSEEILFHVSTRMPSTGTDIEQKVRHLGNDEVHIVWSEHWRDYRRSIFKTQFADILIVIYPLQNNCLYRIQIEKKNSIQFGPLFDGAVVDGCSLPRLVRATAINALRSQRSPLFGYSPLFSYRGRYQDRWKDIQKVVNMKLKSSFEDFAQSVMHPLESGYQQARQSPTKMAQSGQQQPPMPSNNGAAAFSLKGPHQLSETRWSLLKHRNELVPNFENKTRKNLDPGDLLRPRSRTVDDRVDFNPPQLTRNQSVPDNLCDIK